MTDEFKKRLTDNITEYPIFQNIPYCRIFHIQKYGTRFCDNFKKSFVLIILKYDGYAFEMFLMKNSKSNIFNHWNSSNCKLKRKQEKLK